jgi:Trypsin-co-occurring domain 1
VKRLKLLAYPIVSFDIPRKNALVRGKPAIIFRRSRHAAHCIFPARWVARVSRDVHITNSRSQPAGRLQQAAASLEQALAGVKKQRLYWSNPLRSAMPEKPDEMEIEFGLKGTLEVSGFLVAKAASDAHYKVKLTWKKTTEPT